MCLRHWQREQVLKGENIVPIDPKLIELERWNELIAHIEPLKEYIEFKNEKYNVELERLALTPGLDTAFRVTAIHAAMIELRDLIREIEFQNKMYKQEMQNAKRE